MLYLCFPLLKLNLLIVLTFYLLYIIISFLPYQPTHQGEAYVDIFVLGYRDSPYYFHRDKYRITEKTEEIREEASHYFQHSLRQGSPVLRPPITVSRKERPK